MVIHKGGLYSSVLYGGLVLLSGIALCCMGVVCYMMLYDAI